LQPQKTADLKPVQLINNSRNSYSLIDTGKFYPEARRILKPGGVIAVWVYGNSIVTLK
jgi:hypothetical protein